MQSRRWAFFAVALFLLAGLVVSCGDSGLDGSPDDLNPDADLRLAALGDSWISGEGSTRFYNDTNIEDHNECRRTDTAYPYLIADDLGMSLTFTACSGADIVNIAGPSDHADPDDETQLERLEASSADAVLISVGGNDAGFGNLVSTCANPAKECGEADAGDLYDDASGFDERLANVYRQVREAVPEGTPVFALPYPNPLPHTWPSSFCGVSLGISISDTELAFLQRYIADLRDTVAASAAEAGIGFIDVEPAFEGYKLCDRGFDETALNVVGFGLVQDTLNPKDHFHNSAHPNPLGHVLLRNLIGPVVAEALELEFPTRAPPPRTTLSDADVEDDPALDKAVDAASDQADVEPIPMPQLRARVDTGREPPADSACAAGAGTELAFFAAAAADRIDVEIDDVRPGGPACYQDAAGEWVDLTADDDGQAAFEMERPAAVDPASRLLYLRADGEWVQVTVVFPERSG